MTLEELANPPKEVVFQAAEAVVQNVSEFFARTFPGANIGLTMAVYYQGSSAVMGNLDPATFPEYLEELTKQAKDTREAANQPKIITSGG